MTISSCSAILQTDGLRLLWSLLKFPDPKVSSNSSSIMLVLSSSLLLLLLVNIVNVIIMYGLSVSTITSGRCREVTF